VSVETAATLGVTLLVATAGYLAKYFNDLRINERTDRLERLNRQLTEFYGPLYSLVHVGNAAWEALWLSFPADRQDRDRFWSETDPPTEDETQSWRLWMREVFMPLNRRMVSVIVEKADLLDGPTMPLCLVELCTHVYAYETVLQRWEEGDFSTHLSVIGYPREQLLEYVDHEFPRLKLEQQELLGELHRQRSRLFWRRPVSTSGL
jgi:hypothetical protein